MQYEKFMSKIVQEATIKGIPVFGKLSLTYRCNLDCVHCYCNRSINDNEVKRNELTFDQWQKILDQLADKGCLWLVFTGGEPIVREDFFDLYSYARKKGFLIHIYTNGTLIHDELYDFFNRFPPHAFEISLYGRTKETYESVTRIKGSFDKCMSTILRLYESGLRVLLKCPLITYNQHEISEIIDFAKSIRADLEILPMIRARIDGNWKEPLRYRVPPKEVAKIMFHDQDFSQKLSADFKQLRERMKRAKDNNHIFWCNNGRSEFHIDPYGKLTLCPLLTNPPYVYDLLEGNFSDGWEFILNLRNMKTTKKGYYNREVSLQCPAKSFLEFGNFETPIEYFDKVRDELLKMLKRAK